MKVMARFTKKTRVSLDSQTVQATTRTAEPQHTGTGTREEAKNQKPKEITRGSTKEHYNKEENTFA